MLKQLKRTKWVLGGYKSIDRLKVLINTVLNT